MSKFYVQSKTWNVLGEELEVSLCQYEGKTEFKQPFQRAWTEMLFDSEIEALEALRKIYSHRTLTVFEDTGKVLSTFGHESAFTYMKIKKEQNQ